MRTVTFKVERLEQALGRLADAWQNGGATPASISFASWELMHRVLAPKRLDMLRAMCGKERISIRSLSRELNRDFKSVHTDIATLIDAGIVKRDENGILFPYDRIHVEFDIEMAA